MGGRTEYYYSWQPQLKVLSWSIDNISTPVNFHLKIPLPMEVTAIEAVTVIENIIVIASDSLYTGGSDLEQVFPNPSQ
jgi:hypothetical protein